MWWFLANLDFWQWLWVVVVGLLVVVGWLWVVVLGWLWLWIVPLIGLWCFFFFFGSEMYYFIVIDILLHCDVYIILLC